MKRYLLHLLAIAAVGLALGGAALAQEEPQFKLGFAALAVQIPDVVGTPLEDEHHNPVNGDSLQRTTTGLMVWRKADNWTAFTDGHLTWVSGPFGLQTRGNDERFDWESPADQPPASPTADALPTPRPTAPPRPSPTPAPRPNLLGSQPNVVQGVGLEANSVWVLGTVRNEGPTPAYNVKVTARLLADSGMVAGTTNQLFAFLGPGDAVGYQIEVKGVAAYDRAEVSMDGSSVGFGSYARLPITWVSNEKIMDSLGAIRYQFTGTLTNDGSQPVSLTTIYVWFLDDQNRVVCMDYTYLSSALAPGDSHTFTVRTTRDAANPRIPTISQVTYYAAGRLP